MDTDDVIQAGTLLEPHQRMPFAGYTLKINTDDEVLRYGVIRKDGAREDPVLQGILSEPASNEAISRMTIDVILLESILAYLNAGGHPERVVELAQAMSSLPQLQYRGLQLVLACEDVDRVLYYKKDDGKFVEITVGLKSRELDEEEMKEIFEEEQP